MVRLTTLATVMVSAGLLAASEARAAFVPDPPVELGCSEGRRVGHWQLSAQCPAPDETAGPAGWRVERLFDESLAWVPDTSDGPYCLYEWDDAGTGLKPKPGKLPSMGSTPGYKWTHADCHVVDAQSPALDAAGGELHDAWRQAANPAPRVDGGGDVLVAVVDTARPTWKGFGKPGVGQSEHGPGMYFTIANLACQAGCAGTIQSYQALTLEEVNGEVVENLAQGGFFGYQSEIARTLQRVMHDHEVGGFSLPPIVNLSIGWDGRYNEIVGGQVRHGIAAVKLALRGIRCEGGLVFAAAGNSPSGGIRDVGLLVPAAWESEAVGSCSAGSSVPTGGLVTAVGGIDNEDNELRNRRANGTPELVAPSFAATPLDANGQPYAVFTGTSVGAATASAAAALVWHADPSLDADEVVDLMTRAAWDLGRASTACQTEPCPTVKRVDVCEALQLAVDERCAWDKTGYCKAPPVLNCAAGLNTANPSLSASAEAALVTVMTATDPAIDGSDPRMSCPAIADCGAVVETQDSTCPAALCPDIELPADTIAPFETDTQPPGGGCDVCTLAFDPAGSLLLVAIDPLAEGDLYDVQLVLTDRQGLDQRVDLVPLLGAPLVPGRSYVVENLSVDAHDHASLSYRMDAYSGRSYSLVDEVVTY